MQPRGSNAPLVLASTAAGLLAAAVYVNALHNPFVYDDYHTVVANQSLGDLRNIRALVLHDVTRPIVNVSYAVDRAIWGTSPFGFHVTSILLHVVNVVLLYWLVYASLDGLKKTRAALAAFSASAIFAVHPLMTEAVGYISGRSEVLCAAFFLLALLAGRQWLAGGGWRWAAATVLLWVGALASKEPAAMFPFVFAAYDWLAMVDAVDAKRRRLRTVHLPLVTLAIVLGIARLVILTRIEYPGTASVHWSFMLLNLDVLARYVGLVLVPGGQTIFHEVAMVRGVFDPRLAGSVAVFVLLLAAIWRSRRPLWMVSFGLIWFLLLLAPASTLIMFNQGEPMTEHRVYLASCGLFLALGAVIGWSARQLDEATPSLRHAAGWVFALGVASLGAQTVMRNAIWGDPVALWREAVDLAPAHYRPRLLLGEALQDAGRRDEALQEFQTAIRLRPGDPIGYVKVGESLAQAGRLREARLYFLKAVDVDPGNASARLSLRTLDAVQTSGAIEPR